MLSGKSIRITQEERIKRRLKYNELRDKIEEPLKGDYELIYPGSVSFSLLLGLLRL